VVARRVAPEKDVRKSKLYALKRAIPYRLKPRIEVKDAIVPRCETGSIADKPIVVRPEADVKHWPIDEQRDAGDDACT
jgi:hypothetical protein